MKALIIDDERLAREELRSLLSEHSFIQLCGEAESARVAHRVIAEHQPDLIFLDIEMPGKNGFELLESLPPPLPYVIFTTAYNEYAVRAFEVNALDYLMKPIHPGRLADALRRLQDRLVVQPDVGAPVSPLLSSGATQEQGWTEDDRVFVREKDRCWFVTIRSMRLLESEGNHTRVYFDGEKPLLYRTLSSMEERLPPRSFMRANRSQLINLSFVEAIEPWFSGSLKVRLRGGAEVEFSRRQAQLFRERLSL